MTNLALDALMLLVLACFVLSRVAGASSSGPEGPVGAWLVAAPPVILLIIILVALIARGRFDWVPGGRALYYPLVLGVLVTIVMIMFSDFERNKTVWQELAGLFPILLLAACLWAVHGFEDTIPRTAGRAGAATILGLAAAFGWGVMLFGFVQYVRNQAQIAEAQAIKEKAFQEERAAQDLAKFRALPDDTPLPDLLEFIYSWSDAVQKEARAKVAARPHLEDELVEGLTAPWSDDAVLYIGNVAPKASVRMKPGMAQVLEKQLEIWRSTFEYDAYAGKWEPNVSRYIEAADKVQIAGGDLKPQLKPWYEVVRKAKGMEGLAMRIKMILDRK
jgi:hypothetical protein